MTETYPESFPDHVRALREGRLLHVVNHHVTPAGTESALEEEIAGYLRHFDPVLPEHLDAYFATGRWPLRRPGFVVAFYDGHREHATVAAPVAASLGVPAWFLPPTGFLDCPVADQEDFCWRHDLWLPEERHPDGRLALTWDELAGIGRDHVLAAHTATHAVPDAIATDEDVERELGGPLRRLAACSSRAAPALAWRRGLPDDATHPAFRGVRDVGYRYLISATMVQRVAR